MVGLDAREGCGWNEAALDQVVLQVNGDQRGIIAGRSVTQRVHSDVAVERISLLPPAAENNSKS